MTTTNRNEIFEKVSASIIAALELAQADMEAGKAWEFPWVKGANAPVSIDGHPYRGMNYLILSLLSIAYPSQIFGTYKAWKRKGAQVKKYQKGTLVIFWSFKEVIDKATGKKRKIGFAKGYNVFAAEQVEGFDLAAFQSKQNAKLPNIVERLEHADKVFSRYCSEQALGVSYVGDHAFYSHSDFIQMPPREAFKSTPSFYSTLAHELAHSTGSKKRLNREFGSRFGDEKYAAEELVAEISSAMICAALKIETDTRKDHGRYIASWLKTLKNNPASIVTAASYAQKAADMILGDYQEEEEIENEGTELIAA